MMRMTAMAFVAAVTCGAVLVGQQQAPDQKPAAGAQNTVTVSGCIQKGEQSRSGTAGAAGTAGTAGADAFILTNATMPTGASATSGAAAGGATAGAATPSPAAGAGSSAAGRTYQLEGGTDLDKHVGHKVEVTGTIAPAASGAAGAAAGATTAATATAPAQRLRVTSVKMVAATCP